MKIHVRYFASLREALGAGETIDCDEGATIAALRDALLACGGRHAELLARGRAVRCALNHVMVADESQPVPAGAEVAFFPPVTGG